MFANVEKKVTRIMATRYKEFKQLNLPSIEKDILERWKRANRFEKSFEGLYPKEKKNGVWADNRTRLSFDFEGTGFVIRGDVAKWGNTSADKIQAQLYIDSSLVETIELPLSYTLRRYELAWNYSLKPSKHSVELRFAAPVDNRTLPFTQAIIYTDKPVNALSVNKK